MSNCVAILYETFSRQACECQPSSEISEVVSTGEAERSQGSPEDLPQNAKNSHILKNPCKKDKKQMLCKPIIKTTKKRLLMKKTLKKLPKAKKEGSPVNLEVSGSTFASNSTPKISQQMEDFLVEDSHSLKTEITLESSQAKINAPHLDGILAKAILDEEKFSPREFLSKHQIQPQMRSKMVDWMIEVLANFNCREETFFLAVNLMDRHLRHSERSISPEELHLTGLTSMFIASKYEEIMPMKLAVLCEKAGYDTFTKEQVKDKEVEILESVGFDVIGPNVYQFVQLVANTIKIKELLATKNVLLFNELMTYMSKMVSYEYSIIKNAKSSLLAAGVSLVCFKLFEQVDRNVTISNNIQKVMTMFNLNENEIIGKANQILLLAKNFDKIYQWENNLKKFHQELFDELQRSQTIHSHNKD